MRRAVVIAGLALALLAPAGAAAAGPDRLDTLAAQLRTSPLALDEDVAWLVPPKQREALVGDLRASEVPYHVAVLPELDQDESGGDSARILRGLYKRLHRPGIYLEVNERGAFDEASAGVPRDLRFPLSLALGDGKADEGPDASTTVVKRLRRFVALSDRAPAGPAKPFDTLDPLELPEIDVKRGADLVPILITACLGGLLAGTALYWLGRLGAALAGRRHA